MAQTEFACNVEDLGLIPGWGRSPGEWDGYPLQYSCLENPMDRGSWRAAVHGVAKSWTRMRDFHFLSFIVIKKKMVLRSLFVQDGFHHCENLIFT